MNITLVPVHLVDSVFPQIQAGLHKAAMRTGGDMTTADMWQQARAGVAFIFVAHEGDDIRGASLWRGETWSSGPKFRCLALYGKGFRDWIEDMHQAVRTAAGGANLVAEGRPGWQPVFRKAKVIRLLYEEQASP
jgi:hypothetical protein